MSAPVLFRLERAIDVTGVSGAGHVADGVVWHDGTASMKWRGELSSVVYYPGGIADVKAIHGHDGNTRIAPVEPAGADGQEMLNTYRHERDAARAALTQAVRERDAARAALAAPAPKGAVKR